MTRGLPREMSINGFKARSPMGGGASISVNGSMGFYDEWGACEWEGGGDVIRKEVWVLQRQD